jgi:hypothetical protein
MGEAVKRIACWFKGHDPDPVTYLFDGTGKTMCRRCWAVVDRPAATPKGGD